MDAHKVNYHHTPAAAVLVAMTVAEVVTHRDGQPLESAVVVLDFDAATFYNIRMNVCSPCDVKASE